MAGVQFTVICIIVLAATFVPRGSLALNPAMLNDELLDKEARHSDSDEGYMDAKERRQSLLDVKQEQRRDSVTRTRADINDTFDDHLKAGATVDGNTNGEPFRQ